MPNVLDLSPPTLEQSYRQRKRDKAVLLYAKVFQNHRGKSKFTAKVLHVALAFLKWKELAQKLRQAVNQKELFINQWLIASETYRYNTQRKALQALRFMGKYLKQTEDRELQLRSQTEGRQLFSLFYQWIESYNQRVGFREKLFRATAHWSHKSQTSYFYRLRAHTHYQRENKFKYRNFFLVKCVLEIMKRGVPRDLYHGDTDTYHEIIQRLIDIRRLKYLD